MSVSGPRRGFQKTRAGCTTCKIRHVKCGEERPTCERCMKLNLPCEYRSRRSLPKGYAPIVSKAVVSPQSASPDFSVDYHGVTRTNSSSTAIASRNSFIFAVPPSLESRRGSDLDHQYVQHFKAHTAGQLEGLFQTDLWSRLVLQLAESDESLWRGVVAIAALSKTSSYPNVDVNSKGSIAADHYRYGLHVYDEAIVSMRKTVYSRDLGTVLAGCLLTICFETLQGDRAAALRQVQLGLRIIASEPAMDRTRADFDAVRISEEMQSLSTAFEELRVQTWLTESGSKSENPPVYAEEMVLHHLPVPAVFDDIGLARDIAFHMLKNTQLFMAKLVAAGCRIPQHQLAQLLDEDNHDRAPQLPFINLETPPSMFREHQMLVATLRAWYNAMQPIMMRPCPEDSMGYKQFFAARVLMINYHTTYVVVLAAFAQNEMSWDVYHPHWALAVQYCEALLQDSRFTSSNFNLNVGIVLPLFSIAIKCREPLLRKKAIALLAKSQRREGVWDSSMSAVTAKWLMDIEEEGMVEGFVPENARIRALRMADDLQNRKVTVECLLQGRSPNEWQARRTTLAW